LESTPGVFEAPAHAQVDAEVVAHALALLDEGRVAEAQALLARALSEAGLAAAPHAGALVSFADAELEMALDDARPEMDSMIDADGIAFEAMRRERLDEPETVALPAPGSPFHTRTLADLLERQGDAEGAHAIRSALETDADGGEPEQRAQTIRILERWLGRLRGGEA
jgi:hypothetical protein